ncbi:MAG: acetate--CoA ligase family protein [Pelagimonas sp.]|uniref:acetate--CoA ligase family protein n=1 Tax=Pelagimonas sp. TaxID=2073170 RepID=UPI003D6BC3CF
MTDNLKRLLQPRSMAVIGGGSWCENVIRESRKIGFEGEIWPVHPKRDTLGGLPTFKSIEDLPATPDAAFVGVNREVTVEAIRHLARRGAGGAVCFASGFQEAQAELADGPDLQKALLDCAGEMRLLGPNCYGFINALDGAALWPDQHGMTRVKSGVAILTQSSNIALNLTMQRRGLPIAYLGTVGNQAQTDLAEFGMAVLEDERVTALGLHIEGISDIRGFEALAAKARELGKSIVAIKVGASEQASAAAISHTASLAGSDAGARALLDRLGIAQVTSLASLLEVLKLLHTIGPLPHGGIASMSCSGGEASLMADSVLGTNLRFPALTSVQTGALRDALGGKVALANPLDYHTYIWGDHDALLRCFSGMMAQSDLALGIVVLDVPRPDRCAVQEWDIVTQAVVETSKRTGKPMAVLASLPETMPEQMAQDLMSKGVVPLSGVTEGLDALDVAVWLGTARAARETAAPVLLPFAQDRARPASPETVFPDLYEPEDGPRVVPEGAAKRALARFGLDVPVLKRVSSAQDAAQAAVKLGFPVALKGEGIAHKTDAGAVCLALERAEDVASAAQNMQAEGYLVEQMIPEAVVELLIGVLCDPAHGFVLTLGAGGVLTEVLQDSVSMLLPVSEADILAGLGQLRLAPLIAGYRGAQAARETAIVAAVLAVQDFVMAHAEAVAEVEINPVLCGPERAVAVDALIRLEKMDG